MKKLIIYATKYGATEKAAKKLAQHLEGEVELFNLKEKGELELKLNDYDLIAIGGSIYAGKIQKEITEFCSQNREVLIEKRLGLFICCGSEEDADKHLHDSFIEELFNHAVTKGYFGYEYNLEKMNFLLKIIVKKMAKIKESISEIKEQNIKEFAQKLSK